MTTSSLLHLLQLVSPALPVGAYSYSEGLETLVQSGKISDAASLKIWLEQELRYGAIRVEAAMLLRVYDCTIANNLEQLRHWNQRLSAFRETEELREQSWQMGRSLARLLQDLQPTLQPIIQATGEPLNFATAFAIAAATWQIDRQTAVLGYLQSWASNLINAGVRLVPLGQTQGQQVLLNLHSQIEQVAGDGLQLSDDALYSCSWGLAIASMNHETLYSRLFRS
ncbi:MAG: urease accessory protein UreF [Elainellaceae cyanobacterium]